MSSEIILLTGEAEVPHLVAALEVYQSDIIVSPALSLEELEQICEGEDLTDRRLIAYCTSIIVPGSILSRLDGPAYNFHPGPPNYPGVFPANFAVYAGATEFGVTAHVMTEEVDVGPIVGLQSFDIEPESTSHALEVKAYLALFGLFRELGTQLVDVTKPLAELDVPWQTQANTMKEYQALQELDKVAGALVEEDEKLRWQRAFE